MNEFKLIFFDFEVFKYDWLVVFNFNNQEEVIVNDCDKLKNFINSHSDHFFITTMMILYVIKLLKEKIHMK